MASLQGTLTHDQRKKRLNKERQAHYRKKQRTKNVTQDNNGIKRHELGWMDKICTHCGAKFWIEEKDHHSSLTSPSFAVCCAGGKVSLPPLLKPPSYLLNLYTTSSSDANLFRKNIRGYNNLLACTSFGASIDERFRGQGVSNFRIHGQVYHRIGTLLPEVGHPPMFAQLYIYDTDHENKNRHNIMEDLNNDILQHLQNMLDEFNPYIKTFRQVRDIVLLNATSEISMIIHSDRASGSHCYNAPTSSEVATIMIGDGYNVSVTNRDILLKLRDGCL